MAERFDYSEAGLTDAAAGGRQLGFPVNPRGQAAKVNKRLTR